MKSSIPVNSVNIPVKYVLYSHFGYNEKKDFEAWANGKGTPCDELDGVKFLAEHFTGLRELLTSPAYEGVLVLFYAPGFAECLDGIAQGKKRDELLVDEKLRFADAVGRYVGTILQKHGDLASRLRFVTPLDLYDIFGRMNWTVAKDLQWWFIGKSTAIRYDAPKIVEAVVRLRLLGTGIPVFRLDHDVLFRGGENKDLADLGMFKTIASCLRAYTLRMEEPSVASFLLSASYDTRALHSDDSVTTFDEWRGAFATRVFPALPIVLEKLPQDGVWDTYAADVFDPALARQFYGLAPTGVHTEKVSGIGEIGAHPTVSVISGAMLCLSEGAILDLPPFSNFTLNVSWIDDHLKYCLHRELRHLTTIELKREPLLSDAKLDSIMVQKSRPPIINLPSYVLGDYLPTLLWGTVVDAWITPFPLLKYRPDDLLELDKTKWYDIKRTGRSEAVLASALQTALEKGSFITAERLTLREQLIKIAMDRITKVRRQWADLRGNGKETFASVWAKGEVHSYFPDLKEKCLGIAAIGIPLGRDLGKQTDLNPYLHDDFLTLVDDALEYIEWTLNWPKIVQVVRSVEQGTVRTDMSWNPENYGQQSVIADCAALQSRNT
jgi:hypothetical protein